MIVNATNLYEVEHLEDQMASFNESCMKGLSPEREAELAGMTFEGYDLFEMRVYAKHGSEDAGRVISSDVSFWGALLKLEELGYSGEWNVYARSIDTSEWTNVAYFINHQAALGFFLPEFDEIGCAWEIHHSHNVLVGKAKQWIADRGLTVEQVLQEPDA